MSHAVFIFLVAAVCFVLGWTTVAALLAIAAFTVMVLWSLRVVAGLIFSPPQRR